MGCLIPTWAGTVGACIDNGVIVKRYCERCQRRHPVDLAAMKAAHGADYWLWDRRTPCPYCGGMLPFMFSPGSTTPTTPMISTNRHDVARSARIRAQQEG